MEGRVGKGRVGEGENGGSCSPTSPGGVRRHWHQQTLKMPVAYLGFQKGGGQTEAPQAPRGVGCGEGVSPSPLGEGAVPPPQKNFEFLSYKLRDLLHFGAILQQL